MKNSVVTIGLIQSAANVYTVTVDYGLTLEEMIANCGFYGKSDGITTEFFLVKGEGKKAVEITLVHFNRVIETAEAIKVMYAQGYRPATIEELLALAKEEPLLQKSFQIVALGSVSKDSGFQYVPYLDRWKHMRGLCLGDFDSRWNPHCQFAFVSE
jgi:hypothetical protein